MGGVRVEEKINRFLFRLVNKVQPATVIEVGQPSTASLYLQSAKPSASYLFASDLSELFLDADTPVDFLYMNNYQNPELMEEVFHICAQRVTFEKCVCGAGNLLFKEDENALESIEGGRAGWGYFLICMTWVYSFLIKQKIKTALYRQLLRTFCTLTLYR